MFQPLSATLFSYMWIDTTGTFSINTTGITNGESIRLGNIVPFTID
jgi:hypothetical protein